MAIGSEVIMLKQQLYSAFERYRKLFKDSTFVPGLNIKKSNIRIWIHQRDLNSLQQVIWEGHGNRLLVEHSNNPRVKRFLEALPHILGVITSVHTDVINNDLDGLKEKTAPPTPNTLVIAKDSNGLTPLHKAAGLGFQDIAEYIISQNPKSVALVDNEGRTPLHYSVLAKDGGKMFDYLVEAGADEGALDNKSKSAAFYKTRTHEIDAKVLQVIPDCPRKAREQTQVDWSVLGIAATPTEEMAKIISPVDDAFGKETSEGSEPAEETNGHSEDTNETNGHVEAEANGNVEEEEVNNNEEHVEENVAAGEEPEEKVEDAPETEAETKVEEDSKAEEEEAPEEKEAIAEEKHATPEPEETHEAEATPEAETTHEAEATPEAEETPEEKATPEAEEAHEAEATPEAEEPEAAPEEGESEPAAGKEEESEGASEETEEGHHEENKEEIQATEEEEEHKEEEEQTEEIEAKVKAVEEEAIVEGEGVIEGIVNGENEIESVNEEGQGAADDDKDDAEIAAMVEEGNMEHLAGLVLNGEGERLMGHTSDIPELQSFLDNVPVYMSKINRIHVAARDGSLKELQAALDRRKFAIAKDKLSPNGASPLHVAIVFGNTSIVRYLAGRFPETVGVGDDNGRTPLHYAAVVPDNGHYYNLLVHLGANTRAEDKFGCTPEFYRVNSGDFNHNNLLRDFGAEVVSEEMLSDKVPDDCESARKDLDDVDMIAVLERCYNLLHGRRNSNAASAVSTTTISSTSTANPPFSVVSKHTRRYIFDAVKSRLTNYDHNLYDLIWPSVKKLPTEPAFRANLEHDFPAGILIPDFSAYKVFHEFISPIIKDINNLDAHLELHDHPEPKFVSIESEDGSIVETDLDLDVHVKNVLSGSLEATRNLADYQLPNYLNVGDLEAVERQITTALLSDEIATTLYPNATAEDIEDKGSGTYYTMNEILEDPSEARVILASNGLMIPLWNIPESDRLHGKHWPYGRGVFVSNSCNLAVWINVLDHFRLITCCSQMKPGNVGQIYTRVCKLMKCLSDKLEFRRDEKLGYLTARPTVAGNTLQFNLNVRFPHLIKEPDNLRHLCHVRGLSFHRNSQSTDVVRIGNQQCLGITEIQTFEDFCTAVANILQLEKDLAMSNSMHIAALFVNMFKRKKNSAADF